MSKYISANTRTRSYKGRIVRDESGNIQFRTKFAPDAVEFDIGFEELLEDFEGSTGIEITIGRKNTGLPLFHGVADWTTMPESVPDPDIPFCSDAGREKFLDMKLGLMVHWGTYSHLGTLESWAAHGSNAPQWFMDIYYTLWQVWNPREFDAEEWARLVKRAGMQFIQITTKHHEGFCLWDTKTTTKARRRLGHLSNLVVDPVEDCEINFSVMDTPFKRDIIGELSRAFRKHGLGFGLYFSHIDWNDPNFRWDPGNRSFDPSYNEKDNPVEWRAFIERERQQLVELFTNYGAIDQVFFDGTWFGLAWNDMKRIVKEIRKLQPDCMLSDRGLGPYGDFTSPERWIPSDVAGKDNRVKKKVWQVCDPVGTHWSYVPGEVYKDKTKLLEMVIDSVAKGGTIVLDSGPMPHGFFAPEVVDILEYIGRWMAVNGEAIYATRFRDPYQEGDKMYFTRSKDNAHVYLIHVGWPAGKVVVQSVRPKPGSQVRMLGIDEPVPWHLDGASLVLEIPLAFNDAIPCEHAFCFKIEQDA